MMFLRRLLGLCVHEWYNKEQFKKIHRNLYSNNTSFVGVVYAQECRNCRKIRRFEISA